MKLTKTTVEVLKNCASINQGIVFKEGSRLRTMSVMKNVFLTAEVKDEFPQGFAIYDLNEFLGTMSLMPDPDLEFKEDHVQISCGKERIRYYYSNENVVVSPGEKTIKMPSVDISFKLECSIFEKIAKAGSVMKLKELTVTPNGLRIYNKLVPGNDYSFDIPIEFTGEKMDAIIKIDNMKLIPLDYDVEVSFKGLSRFTSISDDYVLEYFVANDL